MPDDPALRIFPDEFVPNVEASDAYKRWAKSSPADKARWTGFRDALLAGGSPDVPAMATKFGKALAAAGKEHMSITHLVGQIENPYPPPDPASPPTPPTIPSVYTADFETGDFSQVLLVSEITPGRITLTTNNPLEGAYSAYILNGSGDYPVQSGHRTEITFRSFRDSFGGGSMQGIESWVTWEQYLDPNFEILTWCIITQFHGGSGSPVFAIEANGSSPAGLVAVVRGGSVNGNYRYSTLATPIPRGQHLRFKVYHLWSTGSDGVVKVWLDDVLKWTTNGPNLYVELETAPYQKGGIYRAHDPLPSYDSFVLLDNIRWYDSDPG
jgi:hypothetical protein